MKKLLLAFIFALTALVSTPTYAQSLTPACSNPPPNYGVVWTSGQWIACLSSFQAYLGYVPLNIAGGSMSGQLFLQTSVTSNAPLNFPPGLAPLTPNDGDTWLTSAGLYYQDGGVTIGPLIGNGGVNLVVGTTPISSGTSGRIEYNNAGILGELATTGSGNVVRATSPTLVTPVLGVATGTSLSLGGFSIGSNALGVTGTANITGAVTFGSTLAVNGASIGSNGFAVTGTANISGTTSLGTGSTDYVQVSGGGSGATVTTNGGTLTVQSSAATTNLADAIVKLGNAAYTSCGLLITNGSNQIVCTALPPSGLTFNDNVTSNTVASASNLYCMNTASGTLTLTLPPSPSSAQEVAFMDCGGNFALHALTILRNGHNLMYLAQDMTVATQYANAVLIWSAGLSSWIFSPS